MQQDQPVPILPRLRVVQFNVICLPRRIETLEISADGSVADLIATISDWLGHSRFHIDLAPHSPAVYAGMPHGVTNGMLLRVQAWSRITVGVVGTMIRYRVDLVEYERIEELIRQCSVQENLERAQFWLSIYDTMPLTGRNGPRGLADDDTVFVQMRMS